MRLHLDVVLGNEAVLPVELGLVPVLVTLLIQDLEIQQEDEKYQSIVRGQTHGALGPSVSGLV